MWGVGFVVQGFDFGGLSGVVFWGCWCRGGDLLWVCFGLFTIGVFGRVWTSWGIVPRDGNR